MRREKLEELMNPYQVVVEQTHLQEEVGTKTELIKLKYHNQWFSVLEDIKSKEIIIYGNVSWEFIVCKTIEELKFMLDKLPPADPQEVLVDTLKGVL